MRLLLAMSCLLLAGCAGPAGQTDAPGADASGSPGGHGRDDVVTTGHPTEGEPAPAYSATALDGGSGDLPDSDVVLLTVWASWCPICKGDEPHWDGLHDEFGERGFSVFAVSRESSRSAAQDHHDAKGFGYRMAWDPDVNPTWGMRDYQPNHVLIHNGTIVSVYEGSIRGRPGGVDGMRADIEHLLG